MGKKDRKKQKKNAIRTNKIVTKKKQERNNIEILKKSIQFWLKRQSPKLPLWFGLDRYEIQIIFCENDWTLLSFMIKMK